MSLPYFKFFPNDWLGSQNISLMSPAEEGAYIHLLALAWNSSDCSLPNDDTALSVLSRLNSEWEKASKKIKDRFLEKDGKLYPKKLEGLFKDAGNVSDSKKTGAEERWGKEKYFESEKKCYDELIINQAWILEQQKYHPNLNIILTLEKSHIQFWGTEAGWEYTKKKRAKTKNWKLTFENAISQKINQVWLPREQQSQQSQNNPYNKGYQQ